MVLRLVLNRAAAITAGAVLAAPRAALPLHDFPWESGATPGLAVVREDRGADADRERHALARTSLEHDAIHGLLQLDALVLCFLAAASRQHHDELVTRVAHAEVVRADAGAQDVGDFLERTVAH